MSEEVQNRLGGPTAGVSRRTIVKGAAWSVPVVAIAVAAPAHAASPTAKYDLSVAILSPSYVTGGASTWTWRFTSNGPDAVPAGSTITVTFTSTNIGLADYATVNLALGTNASLYSTYSPVLTQTVNHSHSSVSFVITLTSPVPAGAYFQYTGGSAWGANFDSARLRATATASSDSNSTNNSASTPLL